MKREFHFQPARSQVIYGHTRQMLDHSELCVRKFAMRVAEEYFDLNALDQRTVPFRWGVTVDELCRAEKHNAQIVTRYMDGTVKVLPADLEDAWVLALPEPYRAECERDLARRRGALSVKVVDRNEASEVVSLGHLMTEFGQLVDACAPAVADGRITEADRPFAKRILNEADDVIAAVQRVRHAVASLDSEGVMTG